jgi:hypothetical protein
MPKPRYMFDELPSPAWAELFNVENIEAVLQAAAREGAALSYSEMLGRLGYHFSRPKMRALCAALMEVDARARRNKQPELAVLVVRASDGIPGAGWWADSKTDDYHGLYEGPEALAYIQKRQAKTFRFWRKINI